MKAALERIVPQGETRAKTQITRALGLPGKEFDLPELIGLMQFRNELLELGVRWVVAWGARFRNGYGGGCVAVLDLEGREVRLWYVDSDWRGSASFGHVCKEHLDSCLP